jgi:hypothetical protein
MAKTAAQHQAAIADFGVDWEKLMGLNWMEFFAFVRALIDAFRSNAPTPIGGGPAADPSRCAADCKAHFECIQAVAACGVQCCGGEVHHG